MIQASARRGLRRHPHRMNVRVENPGPAQPMFAASVRPRRFGPFARELVCRVAKTPPQQVGCPFTTWSLSRLVEHLAARHRVGISTETVCTILRAHAGSMAITRTPHVESLFTAHLKPLGQ